MRKNRILFLFALLMAEAGAWAQSRSWTSGGCTVTYDDSSGKMTISKTPGGNGKMADYWTNPFRLTDNFNWGTAYRKAMDANGETVDDYGWSLETEINDYGETQFLIYVPEGTAKIIVKNEDDVQTEEITDFTPAGYWMDGNKNSEGQYIVTPYESQSNTLGRPWQECLSWVSSITIEDGVTHIGANAFKGVMGLNRVNVKSLTPPTLGRNAFGSNYSFFRVWVPASAYDDYAGEEGWGENMKYTRVFSANLADGTEDAANWKGKMDNDAPEAFPVSAAEGETITAIYGGSLKVKKVTVRKKYNTRHEEE